jgi:hypothetical protein
MPVLSYLHQLFNAEQCQAYIYPAAAEQATAGVLDTRHFSVVPRLFVPAHCAGGRCPYPYELSMVLGAAQCGLVL